MFQINSETINELTKKIEKMFELENKEKEVKKRP